MRNVFSAYHPAVGFFYLVAAIAFCMSAFHPVYVTLSLAGALGCSLMVRGASRTLKTAALALPLALCIVVANTLFSAAGATELFAVVGRAFYLESACFGATMGAMFTAMLLWFSCYAAIMDSEATGALMGAALPTVSLMVSQVVGLVPEFLRRGAMIESVQKANAAAAQPAGKAKVGHALNTLSTLMSWGMEEGIVRADSMRARGYGCQPKRTRYRKQRFGMLDGVLLGVLAVLAVGNAALVAIACGQFSFYPTMSTLVAWWGYVPYAVLMALPLALYVREVLAWH